MKINNEVLEVLENGRVDENKFYLPDTQLDRKLYTAVNKVLSALGGKWNRKAKAHIFDTDITDTIDEVLSTGEYTDKKKEFQFFETPQTIVDMILERAGDLLDKTVLEPSAGKGAIASQINARELDVVELMDENRQFLVDHGYNVVGEDFLDESITKEYDVILANPPFTRQQDIDHVTKMIRLAKEKVVTIMSPSFTFRDNKKSKDFREMLDQYTTTIEEIDEGEFKESGTTIRTLLVTVEK